MTNWLITFLITIGQTPLARFSNINNCDATRRRDIVGGTWPQVMCPHISKKVSKPQLGKSSRTKQSYKSLYTIFKGPLDEKRG
jgi:hypothetical protein